MVKQMNPSIPPFMNAVFLDRETGRLVTHSVPIPVPAKGEVLIKMAAAPINPSDLARLKHIRPDETGDYIPGLEGSGTVVAAGKGVLPLLMMGRRVACSAKHHTSGTWAEYMITSTVSCFPVSKTVSFEQASMNIVNPLTAVSFFDIIRRDGHRAVISTAAAGALGKMIRLLGKQKGIPVVNIVRNESQAELLRDSGDPYVLNSSGELFPEQLRTLARELQATLALDAIGGTGTRTLLKALPPGGMLLLYGNLSGEQPEIDHKALVTGNKKVAGFYLANFTKEQGILHTLKNILHARKLLSDGMEITVQARFPLEQAQQALVTYTQNMTAGKVALVCS